MYSAEAGKKSMSGSRRQVAAAVMNTNKQEIVNGIRVFVMVVIGEFRHHQPRTR
jgi:hypothetical protein